MEPEVHVREHPVPGAGRAFDLRLDDGTVVTITVDPVSGERQLSARGADEDAPGLVVRLDEARAVVLGTLLGGLDVVVGATGQAPPARGAGVETLTVPAGSSAVGRRLADIDLPDPEGARVLAVIRDDTPELLEDDPDRPVQPGDRLVLVGRPGPRAELRSQLGG